LLEVAPTEALFESPQHEYSQQLISLMPEFNGLRNEDPITESAAV
jgi:peptide/nickel transport system ATP-binding protein